MAVRYGNRRVSVTISEERYNSLKVDAGMSGVSTVSKMIAQRLDDYDELVSNYNEAFWLVDWLARHQIEMSMCTGDWASVHVEMRYADVEGFHGAMGRVYKDALSKAGKLAKQSYLRYCELLEVEPSMVIEDC